MNVQKLINELEDDEDTVLHAYKDSLGFLTIGTGRLIDKRRGGGITKEESRYLLKNDIDRIHIALRARLPWFDDLSDTRKRALMNMAFQLGVNGLMRFRKMLAAIKAGDFEKAYDEALNSKWYKQTPNRALRVSIMIKEG